MKHASSNLKYVFSKYKMLSKNIRQVSYLWASIVYWKIMEGMHTERREYAIRNGAEKGRLFRMTEEKIQGS